MWRVCDNTRFVNDSIESTRPGVNTRRVCIVGSARLHFLLIFCPAVRGFFF